MNVKGIIEAVLYHTASETVNSVCWFSAFQEKLPEEVDALRKNGRKHDMDENNIHTEDRSI